MKPKEVNPFGVQPDPEEIPTPVLRERERCVQLVWENRGKCASNAAALELMKILNGDA